MGCLITGYESAGVIERVGAGSESGDEAKTS